MHRIIICFCLAFLADLSLAQNTGRLSAFQALDDMRQITSNSVTAIRAAMASAIPGQTYPTLSFIPDTAFSCSQVQQPGYYADPDAGCQVFRQCLPDGSVRPFICANQTLFNQISLVCDWWYNVDCSKATGYYGYSNPRIYQQNMRFLDDFSNGSVQPIPSPVSNNSPPPAVVFALPGTTPTPVRGATARFNANRPIGRSLTSPIVWNVDGDFFGNMNGGPTALPSEYTNQMNFDENTNEQLQAEENQSLIDAGNLTMDQAENAHLTDNNDEHEISDVTDHRNFRPAIQLNPVFSNQLTSARPNTKPSQNPNAADSVPSEPLMNSSSVKNRVMVKTKNQPLIEIQPLLVNLSQPTTTVSNSSTPQTSTISNINSTQLTTTGKIPMINVNQPSNSTMAQPLVSSTVNVIQPTINSATTVPPIKGTVKSTQSTKNPTTLVQLLKGTTSSIQPTTNPAAASKTTIKPTTRVTVMLHNSSKNQVFDTSAAPFTVVRVRKDVLPAQTTAPTEQTGTEAGLYKQIPAPNLNQQQVPVKSAEKDFYGLSHSPSISLLLTLKRFVTTTNDLLAKQL